MDIEEIKKRGQLEALHNAIDQRIHEIRNTTFTGFADGLNFTCLGEKINQSLALLDEMRTLLAEVQSIDGVSK